MTEQELRERELDLMERMFKVYNLQIDSSLKEKQSAFLPWQFAVTAFGVGAGAGAGLISAIWAFVKWRVGG